MRGMRQAGSKATLIGGIGPRSMLPAICLLALVAIAIDGLFIRAIATGEWAGGLFLVGFAALFGWQIGGFIGRNRPRAYTFDRLPEALLPVGAAPAVMRSTARPPRVVRSDHPVLVPYHQHRAFGVAHDWPALEPRK